MKKQIITLLLLACCAVQDGYSQGKIVQLGFYGQPPDSGKVLMKYSESGFTFTPIDPNALWAGFVIMGRGGEAWPDNGTACYLLTGVGDSLKFWRQDGAPFDILSVDLAEFSTLYPVPKQVNFIGYRADGAMVTAQFITDGIIDGAGPLADFETFHFGPEFSGLLRVEVPGYGWALDNVIVNIPEPGAGALLMVACGVFALRRRRTRS